MSTSLSRRSPSSVHPTRQQLEDLDALLKRMLDLPVNRLEDESDDADGAPLSAAEEARPTTASSAPAPMRGPHRPAFARPPETEAAAPPSVHYNTPHENEADLKPRVIIVASNSPENETDSAAEAAAHPPQETAEERPTGGHPDDWVPLTSSWRPSSRTWKPLTEAWQQAQGANGRAAPNEEMEEGKRGRGEEGKRGRGEEENRNGAFAEPVVQNQASVGSPLPLFPSSPLPLFPLSSQESRPTPRATPPAPPPVWTPWYLWPFVGFNAAFDACLAPWGPVGGWLRGPTGRALLGILGLLCLTAAAALAAADWIGWTS
jgi:hypothetical protein